MGPVTLRDVDQLDPGPDTATMKQWNGVSDHPDQPEADRLTDTEPGLGDQGDPAADEIALCLLVELGPYPDPGDVDDLAVAPKQRSAGDPVVAPPVHTLAGTCSQLGDPPRHESNCRTTRPTLGAPIGPLGGSDG